LETIPKSASLFKIVLIVSTTSKKWGSVMKKLLFLFLLCLIVTTISFGQSQLDTYKKIDYIKVNTDHLEQFMERADNELKSAYSSLVDSTELVSWNLYKVQYPGGEKSHYNFISIATAESVTFFEDYFSEITATRFTPPNTDLNFGDISSLVKSEIWKTENGIIPSDDEIPSRYMTMDYMDVSPGKGLDYLMLENEIAKPIHQERVDEGTMVGWEVSSLILPSGTNYGYNYATGNHFDKLGHIEFGFTNEIIEQTMGKNAIFRSFLIPSTQHEI
jgi:hypothetical protein